MSSKSTLSYGARAKSHPHPVVKQLFSIAEAKKSNIAISADLRTTSELLELADQLGPYIAVFKTHIDLISDFSDATISGLKELALKHNFMIFEDRKFIDIGHTVQQQYHGGALKISEFAHVVNASVLAGEGIIEALEQTIAAPNFSYKDHRAVLILAEMTTAGSLATGDYTRSCIEIARKHKQPVIGFVAIQALTTFGGANPSAAEVEDGDEDFVVFTTGVNATEKGDSLGQQYQTPTSAVSGGSDFVIAGRGIYCAPDPVEAVKQYREEAWGAYLRRKNQDQRSKGTDQ